EHVRRKVVECCRDGNAFGYKLSRLLCSRALPNADGATGASADTRRQRNGGINQNTARTQCRLQLLEQCSLSIEWHGEHQQIAVGAGCRISHAGHLSLWARARADKLCCLLGPSGITRADDDGLSGTRPAQRETGARRAGASDDG